MRVFLGCFLTAESAEALSEVQDEQMPVLPGMRRVPVANLHVTLHFLGPVPVERRGDVLTLADLLPAEHLVAAVRCFTGFPKPARARVLVAQLEDPDGKLGGWHELLAGRWPTGEGRRFDPHATLARSRSPVRLPPLPDPGGITVTLQPPAAYVSETLPEGARYRRLREQT
ncbi:MAG: 2'-5' RNA ligase family protein [Pseudomonadales bacterium]